MVIKDKNNIKGAIIIIVSNFLKFKDPVKKKKTSSKLF